MIRYVAGLLFSDTGDRVAMALDTTCIVKPVTLRQGGGGPLRPNPHPRSP